MSELDQEEREILEAFESGNVKRASDAAATQKRHQEYAKKAAKARIIEPLNSGWDSFFHPTGEGVTDDFMSERASQQ